MTNRTFNARISKLKHQLAGRSELLKQLAQLNASQSKTIRLQAEIIRDQNWKIAELEKNQTASGEVTR